MCICFAQVGEPGSAYPLIFCGNRDEFLSRASVDLHEWPASAAAQDSSSTWRRFGGLDAVRGGTWLCCSSTAGKFRFAVVHNIRRRLASSAAAAAAEEAAGKLSRGNIPKQFIDGQLSARDYAREVNASGREYLGFTLLVADETGVYFTSNGGGEAVRRLEPGTYAISNALLDTPWPKVVHGKQLFCRVVREATAAEEEDALVRDCVRAVLKDRTLFPRELPGVLDADKEILLSSVHVGPFEWWEGAAGLYGTRMHTAVVVRRDCSLRIVEHSLDTSSPVHAWTGAWTQREFDTAAVAKCSKL